MKILVTGGARFIGSHQVTSLVDKSDVVFNLAALLGVKNNMDNAAIGTGSNVIIASTSEIYGKNTDASDRVLGGEETA